MSYPFERSRRVFVCFVPLNEIETVHRTTLLVLIVHEKMLERNPIFAYFDQNTSQKWFLLPPPLSFPNVSIGNLDLNCKVDQAILGRVWIPAYDMRE